MQAKHSFKTAICTDYENLLFACRKALEEWRTRREEVATQGFVDKHISDELLRLQANYARAYARLESHDTHCELCRFVSKIGARTYSDAATLPLEKKPFA
jgi:hypothetical protein